MDMAQIFIVMSVIVFLFVVALVFWVRTAGRQNSITPLAGLTVACVVSGIIFGENDKWIGHGLMGAGGDPCGR